MCCSSDGNPEGNQILKKNTIQTAIKTSPRNTQVWPLLPLDMLKMLGASKWASVLGRGVGRCQPGETKRTESQSWPVPCSRSRHSLRDTGLGSVPGAQGALQGGWRGPILEVKGIRGQGVEPTSHEF